MFELDYLTQRLTFTRATDTTNPRLIGGYAPTFEGEVAELPVPTGEPLALEHDAFLRVVREGGRPEVDGEDGLWAVGIATALLEAAERREVVTLDSPPLRAACRRTITSRPAPAPASSVAPSPPTNECGSGRPALRGPASRGRPAPWPWWARGRWGCPSPRSSPATAGT